MFKTKEELIAHFQFEFDGQVPEDLFPAAREMYDRQLARIEGRDDFRISIDLPDWIPSELRMEYHEKIKAAISPVLKPIFNDALDRHPNNVVGRW